MQENNDNDEYIKSHCIVAHLTFLTVQLVDNKGRKRFRLMYIEAKKKIPYRFFCSKEVFFPLHLSSKRDAMSRMLCYYLRGCV